MSHAVKIYDTCIGCTQCVRACPLDVLEMVPWDGCKAGQIASSPRTEDCVGCKRCETARPPGEAVAPAPIAQKLMARPRRAFFVSMPTPGPLSPLSQQRPCAASLP